MDQELGHLDASSNVLLLPFLFYLTSFFRNFVPISLIVTLEMVKFMQAIIISKDKNLMSENPKIFASVQSSNLNEELGQIQYIFSDKTGTLTCNIMDFKNLTANAVSFGFYPLCSRKF